MDDKKIKEYLLKDEIVSEKANKVFDSFINDIKLKNAEEKVVYQDFNVPKVSDKENTEDFKQYKDKIFFNKFKTFLSVAASFAIILVGSNAYAHINGYDNIFFLLKEVISPRDQSDINEIFEDKDIIISYQSFTVIDGIEMQINEIQAKDNNAKLYILVKELLNTEKTPLYYKVYNEKNEIMFDGISQKEKGEKYYTEILELSNYSDNTNIIKLEIYNKEKVLLKTVNIDLEEKIIEARTENQDIKKISQIELNKFLKQETEKIYTSDELKESKIMILYTYDIFYNDGKYVVKYLFMKPTEEEFDEETVEESDIYLNTVEFELVGDKYKLIKIEKPEIF